MQTNLLMNILMMSPGGMGTTPQASPLLGAQSAVIQSGNTLGEFAGLLGQPGMASNLALSQTNNPTGDIEASPQALDIASLGQNLPGLATYIDQASPALKNSVTLEPTSGNVLDASKKTNIGAAILANINKNKPVISSSATQVVSDVVNEQDFQLAIKNIEAQKKPDGKIVLPELPSDMKTEVKAEVTTDVQDVMTKLAANIAQPAAATRKPEATTTTNTATVTGAAKAAATEEQALPTTTQAASNASAEQGDIANKFKADATELATKNSLKDEKTFTIETTEGTAGTHRTHDIQGHIKEIRIEPKIETAVYARSAADQVEVKISQMIKDGVDMVRIKLHPEELGKIDIQMDVGDDGKTSIRIVADRVETLDMLRRDAHSLEKALKDTGVRTDAGAMQFSLRDQQQQQNFAGNSGKQSHYSSAQVNDNYLKAANVNEYILTMNPQKDGLNILA